ncbi:TPA: DUF1642 domain-containing protein [Enterococcus faecalis]|uniref:DUF1642 domain-containing protein n=5 Tax=Bacilli TaxID=91061 RepID=UPI00287F906D|nr:DUF1642 domain-containing protein [Enterococcus faecalis]WRS41161.1 DUF1642 domain-containing protein [Enterococcus faecalis]HAZ2745376.1 DUF1642 domain-containing protein [Enterococcus faecalis]
MNKQELIEELECIEVSTASLDYLKGADYANERAINLAKQLDEPIKVVVPKFVAEWLDKHKYSTDIIDLFLSVEYATDSDGFVAEKWDYSGEFYDWLSNSADIQFTLCDAMRYGYEVEKEQLYYVKFDILYLQKYLVKNVETNQFYLSNNEKVVGNYEQVKFTEQEIKSIDERYWPFAVKVEDE